MKVKDIEFFKAVRDFLEVYLPSQRKMSPNTIRSYRQVMNLYFDFLKQCRNIPLSQVSFDDLTTENMLSFVDWLGKTRSCKPISCNQRLMAMRSFANYAALKNPERVYIKAAVALTPTQKCQVKVVDFLSDEGIRQLLFEPDRSTRTGMRDSFMLMLLYDTAARCQEILDLRLRDFVTDCESPYVYLTGKGNKRRTVPLMKKTVQHMATYLTHFHPERERDSLLFYTIRHGKSHAMSPDNVQKLLKKYAKMAHAHSTEVPESVHPHQLRHSRAIAWYRSGIPLALIAELLGHSDPKTSQIYAYADTEMKRIALSKAMCQYDSVSTEDANAWTGDDELIRRLYGLKS